MHVYVQLLGRADLYILNQLSMTGLIHKLPCVILLDVFGEPGEKAAPG